MLYQDIIIIIKLFVGVSYQVMSILIQRTTTKQKNYSIKKLQEKKNENIYIDGQSKEHARNKIKKKINKWTINQIARRRHRE